MVPNIGNDKGGMELRFGTSVLRECGLDGITSSSGGFGVSASLCSEWSESDMAAGGTVKTRKQQRWLRTRENRETRIKNKITYDGREPLLMADKWWRRTGVVED